MYQVYDGAGIVTSEVYDFKGNLLESQRELLPDYKQAVDWLQNPAANDGSLHQPHHLRRAEPPVTATSPDGSVYRPTFNEANLLDKVDVNLRGAAAATAFRHEHRLRRQRPAHTDRLRQRREPPYEYDPLTFA